MKKGLIGAISSLVVVLFAVIMMLVCTVKIPAGYVGVVYSMSGGISDKVLTQGFHVVSPMKSVTTYSVGLEQSYLTATKDGDSKGDDSFEVPSSDGKGLNVDLTFTYRFDQNKVSDTFTRFKGMSGADVKSSFIKPNVMSWTKEVTARYTVVDMLGDKRSEMNIALAEYLKEKFEPYGIIIESAALTNINPDEETRAAIQKKVNAQQEMELAKIEAETATIEANKNKEVAIIEAEKKKETAALEAEALLIAANAEAEANKVISDSLSDKLIEQQKIAKWNGSVPQVSGSGSSSLIIDVTG